MRDNVFNKKVFIKSVKENLMTQYRKDLSTASNQEIFQAVCISVKDVIMDEWLATQQTFAREQPI